MSDQRRVVVERIPKMSRILPTRIQQSRHLGDEEAAALESRLSVPRAGRRSRVVTNAEAVATIQKGRDSRTVRDVLAPDARGLPSTFRLTKF